MAKRLTTKEILEAARRGGPVKPADEGAAPVEEPVAAASEPEPAAPAAPPPPANVPSPSTLGRPLSLKEKLAAARAGGTPAPTPAARPAPAPAASESEAPLPAWAEPEGEAPPAETTDPAAPPPSPSTLGRPLTLKEKLAAARSAGGTAPAPAVKPPPAEKPAAPKPAPAKPAAAAAAARPAAPARALPPVGELSDPKDLAEAARQAAARRSKEADAAGAKGKPAATKAPKAAAPSTVLPKPKREPSPAARAAVADRRGFLVGSLFVSWVLIAWASFTAGLVMFTQMMVRFMFPNVLAEPPSTIKIGLPANYDPEDVNERFKAEWGFWVVRTTRVNGTDIVFALQSVCTHLGCPPNWLAGEQKFKCPCHGSGFYISGVNFEGPAPRPLERFKVTLADDGQIIVDKSQKFQQELGQWNDPDSFITA